ncbi:HDOD domain-containing protein [Arcobacter roscoffensis]|uniref:HDOD domain-containing protein n=1 Tax=Arcobacter roscoffensis TaxID=2961520 RepID=A0ABY5E3G2_9BACT|nr:HDOD domain-containing protein [Arcobacter roscoffensis]UTJ06692.1 HDOD domain-containing protein [Arcobacter roscoffensis]
MKNKVKDKIDSLPPLPNSIMELEEFKKVKNSSPDELITIIEKDPLLVANILKVANSSMFGFRSSVDTLSRAINLLGINFTISLAIGSIVQNTVKCNLLAYGMSTDDFINLSALSTKIINEWVSKIDNDLKDDLLMPAFLQETGKFIIASIIEQENKIDDFRDALNKEKDVSTVELNFTGFTTAKITANLFKHWGLTHNIIYPINFVDDINNATSEYKKKAQILKITKELTNFKDTLGDSSIDAAIKLSKSYGFDEKLLNSSIQSIKDEILNNS